MLKKYNQISFNDETLELLRKTQNSTATLSKKVNSPKYLVIDWAGVDPQSIDFHTVVDLDLLDDDGMINDDEVIKEFYRRRELSNEEYLRNSLVDNHIISDELYQKNTYEENLHIFCKMRKVYPELKGRVG